LLAFIVYYLGSTISGPSYREGLL